ncbi:major facilitator superfamily domain-containing protein [Cercophora newfieldiana]|uniref:Major facilitator superfamily domain-containing protein n=1 Tax=Cercophora newfieldiana TaxID=92897 RepID=A0AA39XZ14_9PEZI|nr:major facilitator superfamily domain-containing protein [Cercophora newfieldiana]
MSLFQTAFGQKKTGDATNTSPPPETIQDEEKKGLPVDGVAAVNGDAGSESDPDAPTANAQRGIKEVEAVALAWSRTTLILVFVNIWCLYLVKAFQYDILYSLVPFVTSEWESHSQLNIIYVVADTMTAACYIPLSKILDLWGRATGFAIMTCLALLGMVLMAACNNLPTFCAAYVFYSIGWGGMTYCVDVITADISKLKNRGLAYAFTSSPYMITAFAGPKAAESFYENISWRWGFGCFSIILPVVAFPLYFVLENYLKKAKAQGILVEEKPNRTLAQSIWHYVVEFDALGVFLFAGGFTVFLLPFTLAYSAPNGWQTGYIIAMIVVGFVVLVAFGFYESLWAPVPMLNFKILTNRTVIGACGLDIVYMISYYCWANYFTSFLMVVNNVSMSNAGYISNTFGVVSGVLLILVGFAIRKTGYYKWLLYIAVPIYILAQGLMIYFRRPNQSVGFLIMCQVFTSFGGSIFIIIMQVAILAAVDHQHVAAALALLFVAGTTGGAIGGTISGAIWTNTFHSILGEYLPEELKPDLDLIYSDLAAQLEFEVGSDARIAIQEAYGYSQTRMLAAGTAFMAVVFVFVLLIKNINVSKIRQVKGMVF